MRQGDTILTHLYMEEQWLIKYSGEINFQTEPFSQETEITGHPLAHLVVSMEKKEASVPSEMDLFLTIRHYDEKGVESQYNS